MNPSLFIGCCGAYCKTCRAFTDNYCKGCKIGYDTGNRDIEKTKCKIKLCCFKERKLDTCADCPELNSCPVMLNFFAHNGYKYKKYRQAIEYLKENGFAEFIRIADRWKGAYGKYD